MSNYRDLAGLFKVLANPHRLALFARLAACCSPDTACCGVDEEAVCVGDAGAELDIAPSTVSHHLKELRQAGLIRMERRGQSIFCWAEPEALRQVRDFIEGVAPSRRAKARRKR
jgi:ArsR family transcriptional regulator